MSIKNILLEERAPYSNTMKAILFLTLLFLVALTIFSWAETPHGAGSFQIVAILTLIVALAFWSFFTMRFRITTLGVEASMVPFSYGVKYEEIEDVYVDKVPWWIGWGLRLWWRIAFISMHKPSVVIKKKSGVFRTFILSTKDPENFAKKIRKNDRESVRHSP
ncbi:MAG: hypothetical protein ACE5NL_01445 [Candidatus Hydrothermarchaeaceae archaeon]